MKDSDLRFNILTAAALGVVVILAAGTGRAADGAGVGQSAVDTSCGVSGAVTTGCDTTNAAWKACLGYQFNRWLGLEGGYVKFGDVTAAGSVGDSGENKIQMWTVGLNYEF